ncbi:Sua5/YciO/YrdC/YwlC family protein [Haloimpatiens lingqiaonensis]|uniref:Kae1-like domain-containing protein n=1 Tax=Haloimpatiens lingqiaonensis TaxID=1380675 RepID=UPI0010FEBD26|nr:Sua5/YciO/YrdC/YwlC family protein [Haloimpatiens lingqiaonensis]
MKPELILTDNKGKRVQCEDEIKECALLLNQGKILGIKGIGGFHIVCNALNEEAVLKIRNRKKRPHKPLAMMMKDIGEVKKYCEVSKREEEILISNKRPIVLLRKKYNSNICQYIAPNMRSYGVMLPYTPMHNLLFLEDLPPLVMTSGNISGSPTEYTDAGALENLSTIVEFFLLNNRKINTPVDDSVVKVVEDKVIISRPGRGFSPYCLHENINNKILALGGEQKGTFSFSLNGISYMSQYFGDLKELKVYKEYLKCIKNMKNIFQFQERIVSFDMHPNYMSTVYGKSLNSVKVPIQHHHAHMASCMLEHNIMDKVIGIIYDGTGYGLDGNSWGGEFFIGNRKDFKRAAHFKYTKIQGGDSAQKNIWKIGISYLKNIEDGEIMNIGLNQIKSSLEKAKIKLESGDYNTDYELKTAEEFSEECLIKSYEKLWEKTIENLWSALDNDLNCYKTSSVGRLFDAVSSILGLREIISYDAQGAIELEDILDERIKESYPYVIEDVLDKKQDDSMYIVDYSPMLMDLLKDMQRNIKSSEISAKFHNTIINITVEMANRLREQFKINIVVLSGGVFENRYILKNTYRGLKDQGFQVFFNEKIPTNDSGISLGQVAIAEEIVNNRV